MNIKGRITCFLGKGVIIRYAFLLDALFNKSMSAKATCYVKQLFQLRSQWVKIGLRPRLYLSDFKSKLLRSVGAKKLAYAYKGPIFFP